MNSQENFRQKKIMNHVLLQGIRLQNKVSLIKSRKQCAIDVRTSKYINETMENSEA
jgi:hypothetical protein